MAGISVREQRQVLKHIAVSHISNFRVLFPVVACGNKYCISISDQCLYSVNLPFNEFLCISHAHKYSLSSLVEVHACLRQFQPRILSGVISLDLKFANSEVGIVYVFRSSAGITSLIITAGGRINKCQSIIDR